MLRTLLACMFFFMCAESRSQTFIHPDLEGLPIARYEIIGNRKTKPFVILREVKQVRGDTLNLEKCRADLKRILSLGLFNRVIMTAAPKNDSVAVQIIVTEQWYIIPFPILHLVDRDWNKVTYGLGVRHSNVRGRAETASGILKLGFNPQVSCTYVNPWVDSRKNWSAAVDLSYSRVRSKHFESVDERVDENRTRVRLAAGRRFGFHTFLSFEAGADQIMLSPPVPGQTLHPSGRDRFLNAALFLSWDHRDYSGYPMSGWLVRMSVRQNGFTSSRIDYSRASADLRLYLPAGVGTVALRTDWSLSRGRTPVYDRTFLGYSERIRGHFFETSEGENRAVASAAFRRYLVKERYFSVSRENELSDMRFGLGFGLFADTGLTWFQGHPLKTDDLISGYGGGLHFLLPYNTVLRLECAFSESGRRQWIADVDVDI